MNRMALTAKGPVEPTPEMSLQLERVVAEVGSWPNVTVARHRDLYAPGKSDGADFHVGDVDDPAGELGHLHLNGDVHLATTHALRVALIEAKIARPMPWYDDWSTANICDAATAEQAIWLYRLNYDRIRGCDAEEFANRVRRRADVQA